MTKKILLVDDEVKIRELAGTYLEREGFEVGGAGSGPEALDKIDGGYDLVILDLMLPGMDGFDVCKEIRKKSRVPIIMLTARNDEIDRVLGLELGADDYVVKPFSPRELVARVKAVLRRTGKDDRTEKHQDLIEAGDVRINEETREVFAGERQVSLTPKEYDLLLVLARYPGRVFTREQLLERIWGYDFCGDTRTVDTHMTRLREKIARGGGNQQQIATVWGIGYKFEVRF